VDREGEEDEPEPPVTERGLVRVDRVRRLTFDEVGEVFTDAVPTASRVEVRRESRTEVARDGERKKG
jgi:hypothetical protein